MNEKVGELFPLKEIPLKGYTMLKTADVTITTGRHDYLLIYSDFGV